MPPGRATAALVVALLAASCASIAHPPGAAQPSRPPAADRPGAASAPLVVIEGADRDPALRALIHAAVVAALDDVAVWGGLRASLRLVVHPDHEGLEHAIRRRGLPWLRAWAQYDRIDLQSPRTFGHRDLAAVLRELLTHELTHVVMYQRIGSRATWSQVWIPFWFREGMASWTSRQGYRRGTQASLGRRLAALERGLDPLLDGEALVDLDQPLAYGAAHWGFERLVRERGVARVRALLDDVGRADACARPGSAPADTSGAAPGSGDGEPGGDCSDQGAPFGPAFERHAGEREVDFAARFRRDLLAAAGGPATSRVGCADPPALAAAQSSEKSRRPRMPRSRRSRSRARWRAL